MKYMTDANNAGLAKQLREKGIDCETVHKLIIGNEDSRVPISDPAIFKFLWEKKGEITLITNDNGLAEYCVEFGIPCIRPADAVFREIQARAK
jgi:rRNA-processing protein FCF1